MENKPFRDNVDFCSVGQSRRIDENLNDLDADVIFIKNIDNMVPDKLKAYRII